MARDDTPLHEDPGADKARAGIQSVEVGFPCSMCWPRPRVR